MSLEHFQWWDLIRVVALLPFLFIGPLLLKLYRRGGIPTYSAAALLVLLVSTLIMIPIDMLFDAPDWIGWVWMGVNVAAGFTALAISWHRNRLVMLRPSGLTDAEHDLFVKAEQEATHGTTFDTEAGLADLRRRARSLEVRPGSPAADPGASASSPHARPASHRLRSAAPGWRTDSDRPAGRGWPPRRG